MSLNANEIFDLFFPACVVGAAVWLYMKWIRFADQDWRWATLALISGAVSISTVALGTIVMYSLETRHGGVIGVLLGVTGMLVAAVLLAIVRPNGAWRWGVGIGLGAAFSAALGTIVMYSLETRHGDVMGRAEMFWLVIGLAAIFFGLPAIAISAFIGRLMRPNK